MSSQPHPPLDEAKGRAFTQKAVDDLGSVMAVIMCALGDRLGLFKALTAVGPVTSQELAQEAGTDERYTREWLATLVCAGYMEYDSGSNRYTLPPEHAPVLAQEGHRVFLGGVYQQIPGLLGNLDQLTMAFTNGGGVPQSAFDNQWWEGQERFTAPRFENLLLQRWVPAMPEVQAKLERGVAMADIGCGAGRALIKLAQAFPNSRFFGYDVFAPNVESATQNALRAGLEGRITFEQRDAVQGLPQSFDLISTFDVVHDAADPSGLVSAIRRALNDDGHYVVLDIACADKLEDNIGSPGTLKYGVSVMYCMTTSLSDAGAGLGTMGLPESKLRELTLAAGFDSLRLVWGDAFASLYEVKP